MQRRSLLSSFLGGGGCERKERRSSVRANSVIEATQVWWSRVTSESPGDPSGVLWELQIQYCGWQMLREVTENLLITGDTSETQSRSCRGPQRSGGSCDELFFKICKALGRHEEVCSSLRGGQIMLEDKDESGFRWSSVIYIYIWTFYRKPCQSKQEVRRSGHMCFPPAESAINKAETLTTINIPSREMRMLAAYPGLGSSDGPGWQNKKH